MQMTHATDCEFMQIMNATRCEFMQIKFATDWFAKKFMQIVPVIYQRSQTTCQEVQVSTKPEDEVDDDDAPSGGDEDVRPWQRRRISCRRAPSSRSADPASRAAPGRPGLRQGADAAPGAEDDDDDEEKRAGEHGGPEDEDDGGRARGIEQETYLGMGVLSQ